MRLPDVRTWFAPPAVRLFLGSRLLIWLVALYAWLWFKPHHQERTGDLGFVTNLWARADSNWFIGIAQQGYHRNGGEVFYPLYPLGLAGLGRALGGNYVTAGIVISLLCGTAAFVLLYRLALPRLGEVGARRSLLYLAAFPMSLFLQAVYSESMYLLCAVAAFYFAERRAWARAAVFVGLAMLTRATGVALLPAIGLLAWRASNRRRAMLSLGIAPILAALYPIWLTLSLHAPRSAFTNEAGWNRHLSNLGPLGGLWNGVRATWAGIEQIITGDRVHSFWTHSHSDPLYIAIHNIEDFAYFAVFAFLSIVAWRRFGAPYGLYCLAGLALPLSVPHLGYPLLSMPRFCLTLFPAFFALASLVASTRRERVVLITSSAFLGVTLTQWATGQWVS